MKVLVTGGAGFIGSNLVDRLVTEGHEVVVIDNESSVSNEIFYWNSSSKNYKMDILDYDSTRSLYQGVDIVFHLAAEARIQPSLINPLKTVSVNVLGITTVLQCCREAGVRRVVYSSTSSSYGNKNRTPFVETMKSDCLTPYSVSKVSGEDFCRMYSKLFALETIIFRYFNVYGERQPLKGQYAPVIGLFLRQKKNGQPMTIVGDGYQKRDFTHVSDVVDANLAALYFEKPDYDVKIDGGCYTYNAWEWGQIYNIGTGVNYSINEIAEMVGGETVNIPARLGETRETLANISKAKNHFGWNPKVRLQDWIAKHK